jgi:hypothetical protein
MKKQVYLLLATTLSFTTMNALAVEESTQAKTETEAQAEEERCTVPGYAKMIGHEELWKKHNGCPATTTPTKEDTKEDIKDDK